MLTLNTLPIEILRFITSLITRWNEVEPLCFTGNSLLTTKLQLGGLVKHDFDASVFTKSGVAFLSTIRLESAHVRISRGCHTPRVLIHHMSPHLRHLTLTIAMDVDLLDVFTTSNLNLASTSNKPLCNPFEPWMVSNSLPVLESLHFKSNRGDLKFESLVRNECDASFWLTFLQGLPRSLTSFRFPYLVVHDWNVLPPHITSLRGVIGAFPLSTALHESVQDLSLFNTMEDLHESHPQMNKLDRLSLRVEAEFSMINQFVVPPNLTRLSISCEAPNFMALLQKLTSNIVTLKWRRQGPAGILPLKLDSLLATIPANVTSLTLIKVHLSLDLDPLESTPPCPGIRRLNIFFWFPGKDRPVSLAFRKIMSSMSRVEHMRLIYKAPDFHGIAPDDLVLFSRRLRYLKTKLSPDCLALQSNGSYPALVHLPNLTHLRLRAVKPTPNFVFAFSSIPPTVTALGLGSLPIRSSEMQYLPLGLINLYQTKILDDDAEHFPLLLMAPDQPSCAIAPTSTAITPLNNDTHSDDLSTLTGSAGQLHSEPNSRISRDTSPRVPASNVSLRLSIFISLRAVHSQNCLGPKPSHFWLPPSHYKSLNCIEIDWSANLPHIPSFVCHLSLEHVYDSKTIEESLTPSSLPHLESLSMLCNLPSGLDLSGFARLRSLTVSCVLSSYNFELPPSLTSLICSDYNTSMNLPASITRFRYSVGCQLSSQALEQLENLVEFGSVSEALDIEKFGTLAHYLFQSTSAHPLMTTLWTSGSFEFAKRDECLHDHSSFATRFPSLEHLYIRQMTPYSALLSLYSLLPPRTILHGGSIKFSSHDVNDLLQRCLTSKRLFSKRCTIDECIREAISIALPRWKDFRRNDDFFSFDDACWQIFASILSPQTHTLKIPSTCNLKNGFGRYLPSFITKLEYHSSSLEFTECELPTSITDLKVRLSGRGECFPNFPASLTSIEIRAQHVTFTKHHALGLPPKLTFLHLGLKLEDGIYVLPSSVNWLKIDGPFELKLPQLDAIASHVLLYDGQLDSDCARVILHPLFWHSQMGCFTSTSTRG